MWDQLTQQRLMRANARAHPESARNAALEENMRWYHGLLLLPDLDQDKGD